MGVRVWAVVEDRLIELVVEPADRFRIVGLPLRSDRTTADRVRAALINAGLVAELPAAAVRLVPPIARGPTGHLDLAFAMAALVGAGVIDREGTGWILAAGRLGLDGEIHAPGLEESVTLADAVHSMSDP